MLPARFVPAPQVPSRDRRVRPVGQSVDTVVIVRDVVDRSHGQVVVEMIGVDLTAFVCGAGVPEREGSIGMPEDTALVVKGV